MTRATRYPVEVRERAVRLVQEHVGEYRSQWAAITSIATKCGMTLDKAWSIHFPGAIQLIYLESMAEKLYVDFETGQLLEIVAKDGFRYVLEAAQIVKPLSAWINYWRPRRDSNP